jgi:predicted ABC-type ATPase
VLRAFLLFPAFSNAAEIDAVRSVHDPLAARIRPHVTLVFPFESGLSTEELVTEARVAVATMSGFRISLGRAQIKEDGVILGFPRFLGHEVRANFG